MDIILHEADGLQVGQRHEDGYINLTQMAQASGKLIADYLRLETTKAFLDELSRSMGIPIDQLVIKIVTGKNNQRGSWGHPQIAINCGQWCSAKFAVQVSQWVVEWMTTAQNPLNMATANPSISPEVLELLEAHTRRIESLNRTIHTAIHQQINAIKDTLKVLERRIESSETITIETVKTTTPNKSQETTKVAIRRLKGEGTGFLFYKPVTRNGKKYDQWWYQWEIKQGGEWIKRTKYVPKKLLGDIKRLEKQKAPVREILALLRVK